MGNTDEKGYSPQVVSIFSGCGGLDLGFHLEGYETIWANDFAEWAVKSFEKNFGKVIHLKDITKINPYTDKTIPKCDIVLGGFPCQDFSIIWKQPGLNGTRGGLFRHFAEFVDAKNPKAFVAENVKGLITANKGKAIETIIKDFESIAPGYVVKPHLYNFAEYGVPQFRERILFVGVRIDTGFNFNHPLPTHGPNGKLPYVTAGEALVGVKDVSYNNELININKCYLVNDNINNIISTLNNIDLTGLSEVIIRGTDDIMVILYGDINGSIVINELKDKVSSIVLNDKVIYGKERDNTPSVNIKTCGVCKLSVC